MRRRDVIIGGAAATAALTGAPTVQAGPPAALPARAALIEAARKLGDAPYREAGTRLSPPFDALDYDSYRGVRPIAGRAAQLPLGHGFAADLLPPGWLFDDPVTVTLPGDDTARRFDPLHFSYDPRHFPDGGPKDAGAGMAFSGVRLSYPLNAAGQRDELIVLQGASYFRALARGTVYGLSARALGLGTGGPAPEEFPVTRHISVFGTEPGRIVLGCLIDAPRAAAALIADIAPGTEGAPATVMDCSLHLFAREPLADAGIAPLTSMFQHGDIGPGAVDDFRPAVHDSDVLVVDNGAGERLWRPLNNPARVQVSAMLDNGPRRFGLVQSADSFARFRDEEGAYHRRPSAMVEPRGDWGAGAVMLLEIPTLDEYADNVVAFWRPAETLQPGREHRFAYRLHWLPPGPPDLPRQGGAPALLPLRSASGIEPTARAGRLYVIDFAAPRGTGARAPDPEALRLEVDADPGVTISGASLYALSEGPGGLRASFVLTPDAAAKAADLRVRLRAADNGEAAAPVWLHRWTRARDGGP